MKFFKISFILALLVGLASALRANPAAVFNFDKGENIDLETGMTEFSRTNRPMVFKGLKATGTMELELTADKNVDPGKFFENALRGKALRTGVDRAADSVFAAYGNLPKALSRNHGAISFWLKPENWEGGDREKFRIFFAANDKTPRSNELLIYKNGGNGALMFLMGPNNSKEWSFVQRSIWDWKPEQWHFICATWDTGNLYLYVDGKMEQAVHKQLPDADYHQISIGTRGWKNEDGISLMDDLMIFDKTLSMEDIDRIYSETRPLTDDRRSPLEHKLGKSSVLLDGKLTDGEYSLTSNASFDIKTMVMSQGTRWGIGRDDRYLYFACESASPLNAPKEKDRDGKLWEDESVECHVEYRGKRWQFIFNEAGVFYDSHNHDQNWNIGHLKQQQRNENGRWTLEAALPFEALGISPEDNDRIYLALCRSGESAGMIGATPLLRTFSDRANFIKLIVAEKAPATALDFRKLPGEDGTLEMAVQIYADTLNSFALRGTDNRGRSLYNQTVETRSSGEKQTAELTAENLSKEGIISFSLANGKNILTTASFKYLSPERVKVRYLRTHIAKQILEASLSITPPLDPRLELIQRMMDKSGNTVLEQRLPLGAENAKKIQLELNWDIHKLPAGDYDYYLLTTENGKENRIHHQYFMKPEAQTPWDHFTGGMETVPPAPWNAPEVNGSRLSCLTQQYEFRNSLFPVQIYSQGEALLASEMTLRINGRTEKLPAVFRILEKNPLHIKFQTTASNKEAKFEVNGILEYDGWCSFELTYSNIEPNRPVQFSDLALVLPMTAEYSKLVAAFKPGDIQSKYTSGKLREYWCRDLMDQPVFWVGNADRGIFWGADNMRGSHIARTSDSLQITKSSENAGAVAVIKLIDENFKFTGKRTFKFGIQATPVKKQRQGLRRPYMLAGGEQYNWSQYLKIFNYFNKDYLDIELINKRLASAEKRQEPFFSFYACIYGVSPFSPEWPYFAEEWISSPPGFGQFKQDFPLNTEEARNRDMWAFGCVNSESFLNWQLYYMAGIINDPEIGLRDMYFDMAYPRSCSNMLHGCGWRDDFGVLRKTYTIGKTREFTRRIRKILRDKNSASVLMYHPSSEPLPPVCGLVDFIVDGEEYVAQISREESYYNIFTPEMFQSRLTGMKCGTSNVYLAQFNRSAYMLKPERSEYWRRAQKAPEAVKAVRHYLGYLLIHDVRPQAGAGIYTEGRILEKQLYSVGWNNDEVIFFPYWHASCPVSASKKVLASVYQLPQRKLLVVLLNDTDESTDTSLKLNSIRKPSRTYDLETGQDISPDNLEISARNYRLIIIEE